MGNGKLRTVGGYRLDEAASALQKTIRRGLEVEAVFWAQELESKFYKYVWKRVLTVSHEDVGLGDLQTVIFVDVCYRQYMDALGTGRHNKLPLINAVVALCRAPKSRLADNLNAVVYYDRDLQFEVPDYAYDKHTQEGRTRGRGVEHWLDEGCALVPDAGVDPYIEQARARFIEPRMRPWLGKDGKRRFSGKEEDENGQGRLFD